MYSVYSMYSSTGSSGPLPPANKNEASLSKK